MGSLEDMESKYQSLFRDVSPSAVIVEQVGRIDYFCIGSVISQQGEKTIILTQSKILNSPASLAVRFFDGHKQEATVVSKTKELCVLMTNLYPKCKKVDFFEGDLDHTHAVAIAPASKSSVYNIPGFIIQKPCEVDSQVKDEDSQVKDEAGSSSSLSSTLSAKSLVRSAKLHFTFSCLYGDKSANGVSRLMSGPVFNMDGKVVGIVIRDMEYKVWSKTQTGKPVSAEMGYDLKVCVSCVQLQSFLRSLFKSNDWQAGLEKAIAELIS